MQEGTEDHTRTAVVDLLVKIESRSVFVVHLFPSTYITSNTATDYIYTHPNLGRQVPDCGSEPSKVNTPRGV